MILLGLSFEEQEEGGPHVMLKRIIMWGSGRQFENSGILLLLAPLLWWKMGEG